MNNFKSFLKIVAPRAIENRFEPTRAKRLAGYYAALKSEADEDGYAEMPASDCADNRPHVFCFKK